MKKAFLLVFVLFALVLFFGSAFAEVTLESILIDPETELEIPTGSTIELGKEYIVKSQIVNFDTVDYQNISLLINFHSFGAPSYSWNSNLLKMEIPYVRDIINVPAKSDIIVYNDIAVNTLFKSTYNSELSLDSRLIYDDFELAGVASDKWPWPVYYPSGSNIIRVRPSNPTTLRKGPDDSLNGYIAGNFIIEGFTANEVVESDSRFLIQANNFEICLKDPNDDGVLNEQDVSIIGYNWGRQVSEDETLLWEIDVDNSGVIDLGDVDCIALNFGMKVAKEEHFIDFTTSWGQRESTSSIQPMLKYVGETGDKIKVKFIFDYKNELGDEVLRDNFFIDDYILYEIGEENKLYREYKDSVVCEKIDYVCEDCPNESQYPKCREQSIDFVFMNDNKYITDNEARFLIKQMADYLLHLKPFNKYHRKINFYLMHSDLKTFDTGDIDLRYAKEICGADQFVSFYGGTAYRSHAGSGTQDLAGYKLWSSIKLYGGLTFAHETGHSFGDLADEYYENIGQHPNSENIPNCIVNKEEALNLWEDYLGQGSGFSRVFTEEELDFIGSEFSEEDPFYRVLNYYRTHYRDELYGCRLNNNCPHMAEAIAYTLPGCRGNDFGSYRPSPGSLMGGDEIIYKPLYEYFSDAEKYLGCEFVNGRTVCDSYTTLWENSLGAVNEAWVEDKLNEFDVECPQPCMDTDLGFDPGNIGTVTIDGKDGKITHTDGCGIQGFPETTLIENFCGPNRGKSGGGSGQAAVRCLDGCSEGECLNFSDDLPDLRVIDIYTRHTTFGEPIYVGEPVEVSVDAVNYGQGFGEDTTGMIVRLYAGFGSSLPSEENIVDTVDIPKNSEWNLWKRGGDNFVKFEWIPEMAGVYYLIGYAEDLPDLGGREVDEENNTFYKRVTVIEKEGTFAPEPMSKPLTKISFSEQEGEDFDYFVVSLGKQYETIWSNYVPDNINSDFTIRNSFYNESTAYSVIVYGVEGGLLGTETFNFSGPPLYAPLPFECYKEDGSLVPERENSECIPAPLWDGVENALVYVPYVANAAYMKVFNPDEGEVLHIDLLEEEPEVVPEPEDPLLSMTYEERMDYMLGYLQENYPDIYSEVSAETAAESSTAPRILNGSAVGVFASELMNGSPYALVFLAAVVAIIVIVFSVVRESTRRRM